MKSVYVRLLILTALVIVVVPGVSRNHYIQNHSHKSFFKLDELDEEVVPHAFNQELLEAAVFFEFNKRRAHLLRTKLDISPELQDVVRTKGEKASNRHFRMNRMNKRYPKKRILPAVKEQGYHGKLLYGCATKALTIKPSRKHRVFSIKDSLDPEVRHFHYYKWKKGKRELSKEVGRYTYKQMASIIAKQLLKRSARLYPIDKQMDSFGLMIAFDSRTVHSRLRTPQLKILAVTGGHRLPNRYFNE